MRTWIRCAQENSGESFFRGRTILSKGVLRELTDEDRLTIVLTLMAETDRDHGLYHRQVLKSNDGITIWIKDNGTRCSWMLPIEY